MLTINNLTFGFDQPLFEAVNLQLEPGKLYCLIGANGSGKSTLFRVLHNELQPLDGTIEKHHQSTLYLPVQYEAAPFLTEQQLYKLIMKTNKTTMSVDPSKHVSHRKILADYSTGMLQQVMLNLIEIAKQDIILIDEPLATLDMINKERYLDRLKTIAQTGKIIIISTQEPDVAYQLKDLLLVLADQTISYLTPQTETYDQFKARILQKLLIEVAI